MLKLRQILFVASILAIGFSLARSAIAQSQPNIVILYADDLGFGDVHCNNPDRSRIPTPNFDRLASQGMRFTDAHSSSGVCSPSRYALLTGRYHWRTRLQKGIVATWGPPLIAEDRLTVASLVKQKGYRTACVGKWHLGWDWPADEDERKKLNYVKGQTMITDEHRQVWRTVFSKKIPGGPTTRGFDQYFGTDVPNWPPFCFIDNDQTIGIPTEFMPERLLKNNLASVGGPALADWQLEPILPTLVDRASSFIRQAAADRQPFLLYMPFTSPHTPLAPNASWKGKSGLGPFADLVMETDAAVGQILKVLDESQQTSNTLVLFTADNGCAPYIGVPELEKAGHFPSGPLRGYKSDAWEGGHRIPCIVRWPGVVTPGSVSSQLIHQADLISTLAEILDFKLPANAGEDSFSFLPILKGIDKPTRQQAVSCAASGIPAFRDGQWKLIMARDPRDKANQDAPAVQLYDLSSDLGETTNLASREPDRVKAMQLALEQTIRNGRSSPGPKQSNDVQVLRFGVSK